MPVHSGVVRGGFASDDIQSRRFLMVRLLRGGWAPASNVAMADSRDASDDIQSRRFPMARLLRGGIAPASNVAMAVAATRTLSHTLQSHVLQSLASELDGGQMMRSKHIECPLEIVALGQGLSVPGHTDETCPGDRQHPYGAAGKAEAILCVTPR